ncbi:MAG: TIGR01777 family oxidoreductase [Labilithrix sp.]|nr:TIGR01777 family oxidoreductase [Labilithrix sp.]MCW5817855.1 TIGR01777 family oxidoreductase [Labilithrix sp.]
MRIVVSGGTGLIGKALCHALAARGDEVVILTRGAPRGLEHACSECGKGGRLEFVTWSPKSAGAWMDVVDGADAVVHLAGANVADERWTPERKRELTESRTVPTALLAEAAAKAKKKPAVFVSASGVGHYGIDVGDALLDETAKTGTDFLAQLTKRWEDATKPAEEAGVRVCLARIGLVLGKGGGVYERLGKIFRAFIGGPVGDGEQYMPWIHVRDVVRALIAMIDRSDLSGAYNVVSPEPVTMNVFADAMATSLRRPAVFRVPAFAVKVVMGTEAASCVLTGQRAVPKRLVDAGFDFLFPDLRSALADLAS